MHQDFIFDTAGGISSQLGAFFMVVGVDCLDQADGPDGDQIIVVLSGTVKLFGVVNRGSLNC